MKQQQNNRQHDIIVRDEDRPSCRLAEANIGQQWNSLSSVCKQTVKCTYGASNSASHCDEVLLFIYIEHIHLFRIYLL